MVKLSKSHLLPFTAAISARRGRGAGGGRPRGDEKGGGCANLPCCPILGTVGDDLSQLQEDAGQVNKSSRSSY